MSSLVATSGRPWILVAAVVTAALVPGCGDKGTSPAASSADPGKPAAASSSKGATSERSGPLTTGEIETHDKKKIGFSIALPEGLKDVSEEPFMKEYAKEKEKFDGYRVTILTEEGKRATKAAYDEILAEAEKTTKVLKKEFRDDGWSIVVALEEKGKKAVVLQSVVSEGTVHLFCKGSAEGTFDEAAAPDALAKACGSLKITSP